LTDDPKEVAALPIVRQSAQEPSNPGRYTQQNDRLYTRLARLYDWLVRTFPLWRRWLDQALPSIEGPRVLEASFGTGYLLTRYADRVQAYAIDLNQRMASITNQKLIRRGIPAYLQVANVEALPYPNASFHDVVCTMAFSGYSNGSAALAELERVLKPGGRFILIDVNEPGNENFLGMALTAFWRALGDIVRDMNTLLEEAGFQVQDSEIGGFGSVHLYLASKPQM
jgi:ubiquinone/menaquinone biosynthesis C-methylase UbiE